MRLTLRLTIVLTIVMLVQFSLYAYLTLIRQIGYFERDMEHDALAIGKTIAAAVSQTWLNNGREAAVRLVENTSGDNSDLSIRFVSLDESAESALRPSLGYEKLRGLDSAHHVVLHQYDSAKFDYIFTYIRLNIPDMPAAALEIRESFEPQREYIAVSIYRVAIFLVVILLSTAGLMWLFGLFLIARPIERIREQLQKTGRGDFEPGRIEIGSDEIGLLAKDMDAMNEDLHRISKQLDEATSEKIRTLEQLRHADRLKTIGTLAAGLAHELGTPLNIISGRAKMVESDIKDRPEVLEDLHIISDQTVKMTSIIRQLLDFARKRAPEKSSTDLRGILTKVVDLLMPFAEKRGGSVSLLVTEGRCNAYVDGGQIEQVLMNLIINAIQATETGGVEIGLDVAQASHPDMPDAPLTRHYVITVRDEGTGMAPEQLQQVFDPFFTTKPPGEGTGMGLSIAHGIVAEHGGWIDVKSSSGRGSCFTVYLPAEAQHEAAA